MSPDRGQQLRPHLTRVASLLVSGDAAVFLLDKAFLVDTGKSFCLEFLPHYCTRCVYCTGTRQRWVAMVVQ